MTLWGMGQNFIACDRDQVLLLPPDLGEWLPVGHLARFVIETVEQLDLVEVYGYYRQDGHGRPAHDPAMMVALLLYAYSVGVTSSRAIERRCVDDVAFRVISCNRQPDHSTIARFLVRHRDAIERLFFEVLALCRRSGMVRVGTVAVDSTTLAANASAGQNRTLEGLEAEAQRIIEEAIETDRREDELYGEKRGDELPEELADPRTRKARIKELLVQARREHAEAKAGHEQRLAEHQETRERTGRGKIGRPPKPEGNRDQQRLRVKKYNLTDPDSGIVRHRGMLLQGYNVQVAASEDQIILAAVASNVSPDGGQLEPMLHAAELNLARIGVEDRVEQVLADTGYWHARQIGRLRARGIRALIPPANRTQGPHANPEVAQMRAELTDQDGGREYRRRQQIIEPVFARTKHHRGITRVLRRGRAAVQAEITLIATTHNLLKLRGALSTG
jgi:transposase